MMNTTANARLTSLPIWRDANRLLVEIEQAVRRFPTQSVGMINSQISGRRVAVMN